MATALVIFAAVLMVAAFVAGLLVGAKFASPQAPPPSGETSIAIHTSEEADAAALASEDEAKKNAEGVMHASDADVRSTVERLRARGRAGE